MFCEAFEIALRHFFVYIELKHVNGKLFPCPAIYIQTHIYSSFTWTHRENKRTKTTTQQKKKKINYKQHWIDGSRLLSLSFELSHICVFIFFRCCCVTVFTLQSFPLLYSLIRFVSTFHFWKRAHKNQSTISNRKTTYKL